MARNYYSIDQAAAFITENDGKETDAIDVLEMAKDSDSRLRLCIWLDKCIVARFDYYNNESDVMIKGFEGYIQIPEEHISLNYKTVTIGCVEPVAPWKQPNGGHHVFNSKSRHVIAPLKDQEKYKGRFVILPAEVGKSLEFDPIIVNPEKARIPEQDLFDYVSRTKKQSTDTTQTNIPKLETKPAKEGGRMNFAIYQKLRASCMKYIEPYINDPKDDTTRRMFSKLAKGEPLGRIEYEKQSAKSLFQSCDLTPREAAASDLLAVISNYRMITWRRESSPPHGHEQLPPSNKTDNDALMRQTSQAISEYVCYLPEREADALLSAWEYSLAPKSTPDTELEKDCESKNDTGKTHTALSETGFIKPKRVNQNRAFLLDIFKIGVEKNIESVWLHIKKNSGKDGFLFRTCSKDKATTIHGKIIAKKNLGRTLSALKR